jgi:hypothetical protein
VLASSAARKSSCDEDLSRRPGRRIGEQRRIEPVEHHLGPVDRPPEHVELAGIDRPS